MTKQMRCLKFWICLAIASESGCATTRDFPAPSLPYSIHLIDAESATNQMANSATRDTRCVPSAVRKHPTVLVLSGGGMNGAYPAGLLKGWTASGARPQFDVVTGISVGALIAPFAFLGSEYDAALKRNASLGADNIYRCRPLPAVLWSDSIADSGPLWHLIQTEVTREVLAKVAQAHFAGRRLYVGTTNLDTKRSLVWDLGAIAASNYPQKLDLFRKVLLASSSVPGLLPPVAINIEIDGKNYTELHVDGGVSASLFLQPQMLGVDLAGQPPNSSGGTVYVIVAGKLFPDASPVKPELFKISGGSISGLIHAQMDGDLLRVYLLTLYAGARFALAAVPQDFGDGSNAMAFNAKTMQQLFDEGHRFGISKAPWRSAPPSTDPREWLPPRQGVRLTTAVADASATARGNTQESLELEASPNPESHIRTWLRQQCKQHFRPPAPPAPLNTAAGN